MMSDVKITKRWRGVPPDGVEPPPTGLPHWNERQGFTQEIARACLTRHYGGDWSIEEQVTIVSGWVPLKEQT